MRLTSRRHSMQRPSTFGSPDLHEETVVRLMRRHQRHDASSQFCVHPLNSSDWKGSGALPRRRTPLAPPPFAAGGEQRWENLTALSAVEPRSHNERNTVRRKRSGRVTVTSGNRAELHRKAQTRQHFPRCSSACDCWKRRAPHGIVPRIREPRAPKCYDSPRRPPT